MTPLTRRAAVLAVALAALAGCDGGGKTRVTGKVTMGGKPVVWGSVTLADSTGMVHVGEIAADGSYTVDGVPTGPVKIGVYSPKPEEAGKAAAKGKAKAGGGDLDDPREKFMAAQGGRKADQPTRPPPPAGAWFPVPDKFQDPQTSGLTGTVTGGKPLDIDIK